MNAYDAAVLVVALLLMLIGALKGVVRLLVGIGSLVAGFVLAAWFGPSAGSLLAGVFESEEARLIGGFGLVFAAVVAVGWLAGWLLVKALETARLRWLDRLAGAAAGAAATVLLFGTLSVPLVAYLPADSGLLEGSRLAPNILRLSSAMTAAVPEAVRERFRAGRARLERGPGGDGGRDD